MTYDLDTVKNLHQAGRFHLCRPDKTPAKGGGWAKGERKPTWKAIEAGIAAGNLLGYRPSDFGLSALDVDSPNGKPVDYRAIVHETRPRSLYRSLSGNGAHLLYPFKAGVPQGRFELHGVHGDTRSEDGYLVLPPGAEEQLGAAFRLAADPKAPPFPELEPAARDAPAPPRVHKQEKDLPSLSRAVLDDMLRHVEGRGGAADWWAKVGYACKAAGVEVGDEHAWQAFDEWSRLTATDNYDQQENRAAWDAWKPDRIGPGSIFQWAKDGGWRAAPTRPRPTPAPVPVDANGQAGPPVQVHVLDTDRDKAKPLDGAGMAQLYPSPDDLIYWPGRKATYLFDANTGLWREDPGAVFASAKLSAAASDKTVLTKDGEPRPVKITNTTIRDGISEVQRRRAKASVPFDQDPHLVGTPEGVFDLRTCTARKGRRTEYVAQRLGVVPTSGEHLVFDHFLNHHFGDDKDLHAYVRCLLASFLGGVRVDIIAFFQGAGGSGKSTLVALLRHMLGSYHSKVPAGAFATGGGIHKPGHPHWLCDLRFVNVASGPEIKSSQTLDDSLLNDLTGNEEVTAYRMRSATETWTSNVKVLIYGNELPRVAAHSGIKRRMRRIPIDRLPVEDDPHLADKLRAEAPAIAWSLAKLYAERLDSPKFMPPTPDAIQDASAEFLAGADEKRRFMADCLDITGDNDHFVSSKDIQAEYERWCEGEGIKKPGTITRSLRNLTADLACKPWPDRRGSPKKVNGWAGMLVK